MGLLMRSNHTTATTTIENDGLGASTSSAAAKAALAGPPSDGSSSSFDRIPKAAYYVHRGKLFCTRRPFRVKCIAIHRRFKNKVDHCEHIPYTRGGGTGITNTI